MAGLNLDFPITDPTWIFLIVLVIILFAPLLLNKLKIPHIIGMILAGVLIGGHGLNILERDSSFELFGQVGLYYIMFLAGLEMDMEDFRKNKVKGLVFGLLTFFIPLLLGIWTSMEMLGYGFVTAVLLSSMYSSHTLIAYPIVSRYGLSRQRSVTISIGGTAVTVTLALLVLALVSGMYNGTATPMYWVMLVLKVTLICLVIVFVFPRLARVFFRKYDDAVMQFVFVLALVFLGGGLISLAGMEGILGAFLVGMALNTLIPKVSPLMNRLEFVGNALFIPYFLIGVGMIIDVRTLFKGGEALKVAVVMTVVATVEKREEFASHEIEFGDSLVDNGELFFHNVVHFVGIGLVVMEEQACHPADVFERHVERATALNEAQAFDVVAAVAAVAVVAAANGRKKSFVFVKANGRGGHARALGELFDSHVETGVKRRWIVLILALCRPKSRAAKRRDLKGPLRGGRRRCPRPR